MSFLSKKEKSEVFLVFDIGSASIGAAIVLLSPGALPLMRYATRVPIPFQERATGVRLTSLMLRTLSHAALLILHEGFRAAGWEERRPIVRETLVSLSAPWSFSRTLFLHLENAAPAIITEQVFMALLAEAEKEEERESGAASFRTDAEVVERKLIQARLNGYETARPYGKSASEAEFTLALSYAPRGLVGQIADALSHAVRARRTSFHGFSLLSFAVLRDFFPERPDFLFADISGEQTEVSLVKRGVLIAAATAPLGVNHFLRALQRELAVPQSAARSLFALYARREGTGRLFERARRVIEKTKVKWEEGLGELLAGFSKELPLPRHLLITVDDEAAGVLLEAVSLGDWSRYTLGAVPLETTLLSSEHLSARVRFSSGASPDPFLCLEALFAERLRHA